ncbi:MAG: hypothetical protein Kow0080_25320 [Candidatus Promineifilaceae bacterium]
MTQTILITGATDGIGLALARQYAAGGVRLVLVGKRPLSELDPAFFTDQTYCQADLSRPDCAQIVTRWLQKQGISQLDVVIQNAGVGYYGPIYQQTPENLDRLLAVNLYAPIRLTHALLSFVPAGGQLVFVSSVAAVLPVPAYVAYAAAKAALEGFARNIRVELNGRIHVQVIRPGAVRTGMHQKMGVSQTEMDWSRFPLAAETAEKIRQAIARRRKTAVIGLGNGVITTLGYHLPGLFTRLQQRHRPEWPQDTPAAKRPFAVVTGGADGIGRALALRFARGGFAVGLVDVDQMRGQQVVAEIAALGQQAVFVEADLCAPEGWKTAVTAFLPHTPTVWVHNAGISHTGYFEKEPIDAQLKVLDLNLRAPLQMTAALVRQRVLADGAAMIFVSSLSRFMGYPGAAVYGASKDGVASYAQSLQAAASPHLRVMTLFPGPTRTAHARRYSPDNSREDARMPPAVLADKVFTAWRNGRIVLIPGFTNKVMAQFGHFFPAAASQLMRRLLLEKMAR